MKKAILINLLSILLVMTCVSVHAQQRPSEKSFTAIQNEIKEKQALRNRMLRQMRLPTATTIVSSNDNMQVQRANTATGGSAAPPQTTAPTGEVNQQPASNKPVVQQEKFPIRPRKQ